MSAPSFDFDSKETFSELLDELERFIVYWLGERKPEYGTPLEILDQLSLPEPLYRLYAFCGRWPKPRPNDWHSPDSIELFSTQDVLLRPESLRQTEDGKLEFLVENQGVWTLVTDPEGEDPPIWADSEEMGNQDGSTWTEICPSLTQLLVTFCLQELLFGAKHSYWGKPLIEYFKSGQAKLAPLFFKTTYVWEFSSQTYYLMDDEVLVCQRGEKSFSFGATSQLGMEKLQALQGAALALQISTNTDWSLEIKADGSGRIFHWPRPNHLNPFTVMSGADLPLGLFDFENIVEQLSSSISQTQNAQSNSIASVHFEYEVQSDPYWQKVDAPQLVKWLFDQAITSAIEPGPEFQECLKKNPPRLNNNEISDYH